MKCKVCNREAKEDGFCILHSRAHKNIIDKFEVWIMASNILWKDYLIEIQKNSLTGEWAKEVAKYLLEEENKNVTKT